MSMGKENKRNCVTCIHAGNKTKCHDSCCDYCNQNLSEWKETTKEKIFKNS